MLHAYPHWLERRGPVSAAMESALWTAGAVFATLLALVILFFGVFLSPAN
jgi:hypothetical protein